MINYGSYTTTKSVSVPMPLGFTITGRGNTTMLIKSNAKDSPCTLKVTGNAKMYTDVDGTLGECTSKTITVNAYSSGVTMYVKLTEGTAKVYFTSKLIDNLVLGNQSINANSPLPVGDCSNYIHLKDLCIYTISNINVNLTKLTAIKFGYFNTQYNYGQITGDFTGMKNTCIRLSLIDNTVTRLAGASIAVSAVLTDFTQHPKFEISTDHNNVVLTGSLTPVDPEFFYYSNFEDCSVDMSAWHHCYYVETNSPNITATTIIGLDKCGYFSMPNVVFTTAQKNQFMADLRANVAVVKTYAENSRTFDFRGAAGSGPVTGQGLIDKQFLIDYEGLEGQHNHVLT